MLAILGNRILPGLLDRYLARTNYQAQQTGDPVSPDRPNNLWKPLPGDRGAHGPFDARSHRFSWELWMEKNRGWLAGAALALVAGAVAGALLTSDRDS